MSYSTEDNNEYNSDAPQEGGSAGPRNNKGKGRATIDYDNEQLDRRVHWDPAVPEENASSGPKRQLHKRNKQNMSHGETSLRHSKSVTSRSSTTHAPPDHDHDHASQSSKSKLAAGQSQTGKQQGRRDEIARVPGNQGRGEIRLDNFPALVLLKDNREAYDEWMAMAREASSER